MVRLALNYRWIVWVTSAGLLYFAIDGLRTGSTMVFNRTVTRSEDALLYWCGVFGSAALGIACAMAALLGPH